MKNSDSQIIRYTKHWFERNDVWEDLAVLIAARSGLDPNHIDKNTILRILSMKVQQYCIDTEHENFRLEEYNLDILPDNCWKIGYVVEDGEKYDAFTAILYQLMHHLSSTVVKGHYELDDTDYTLLPKRKDTTTLS